jgi:hypothetical protein
MVAYSYQKRFVEPMTSGHPVTGVIKNQTIRAERKRHARPGEMIQNYTGMRTKHCRLVIERRCLFALPISINVAHGVIAFPDVGIHLLPLDLQRLVWGPGSIADFARRDGFLHWKDMAAFWHEQHPETVNPEYVFTGMLIRWSGK